MDILKPGTYIDFMKHKGQVLWLSGGMCVLSIVAFFFPGPKYGLDFQGGSELQLHFRDDISVAELRSSLGEIGYEGAEVVAVAERDNEYIIRVHSVSKIPPTTIEAMKREIAERNEGLEVEDVRPSEGGDKITFRFNQAADIDSIKEGMEAAEVRVRTVTSLGDEEDHRYEAVLVGIAEEIVRKLDDELGERGPDAPLRSEWVGPKAGEQLRDAAIQALLYALVFITIYIAFRFDLRFAPGALVSCAHDVFIMLGVYILVRKEVNLTTVAAVLTIIGYSLNDTIVIYDRIRENMARMRGQSLSEIINVSTSQTTTRTIVTGGTTLASLIVFYFWGTPAIADISFALFVGIVIGTYSSVFVAAPFTEWMDRKFFSKMGGTTPARRRGSAPASV